ncbi:MAG TPA: TonB-dependent receptor [Gemmatimonadaceae bacterium]|nr:TonB-dependent receptor [Gemmatimonadaceae bacterium]
MHHHPSLRVARPAPLCAVTALAALTLVAFALVAAPLAAQPRTTVVRVTDAATGRPVSGAELRVGTPDHVVRARTDARGLARLPGVRATDSLRVRAVGYVATAAPLPAGDTVSVRLAAVPLALDQLVVTAARRPQRLADAVVTTEVVSRREIEQTGASDLASVVAEQTGVQAQAGTPSGAGVMLQGIGAERVLVLLDGQPLVGRISGNFDLSRLPTAMVERVEVVRGPQSTLYGSEAMGGVVNIITRTAPDARWSGTATLLGGTGGRRDGTLGATLTRGDWSAVAGAGLRTTHRAPGVADEAGALADRGDGSLTLRWAPDSARSAEVSALVVDERQRWRSGPGYQFADNVQTAARLTASMPLGGTHRLTPTLHLSRFDHLSRAAQGPVPVAGTGDRQRQQLLEAELLYAGRLAGAAVDAGVEARRESISSSDGRIRGAEDGRARTLHSAEPFAQVELGGGAWSVVPGARLTWNEQWGSRLTPRVATRWRATDALTLRLSTGRGFRAPDFKELYLDFLNDAAGYAVSGNPDLRPETSDNVTAGAEWSAGRLYARTQLYWNRLHDFIEARPVASDDGLQHFAYANVAEARTAGADLELGVVLGRSRAEAAYSYLDTEDRATGLALLGRAPHSARATLSGPLLAGVRGTLTGLYTGSAPLAYDVTGRAAREREAFARADVRLARALPRGLELVVGVDNLFDARPAQWEAAVARRLYTALSWTALGGVP